ncbi:DUF1796 family putative cysteine peptidase [Oceanicoccus sp. KOV_DT_Chl]|uniref:DUF1796 family putative cysteine peptidase n=1 Tax=Oceanicoccus sp. KOV_DT_Chl TaxID=1904639 RepID=UPI0011AFBCD7|nr:DUF1796 family putative cysteine peptidase [Oceanicoccus sp. KOV_DT_Chl]
MSEITQQLNSVKDQLSVFLGCEKILPLSLGQNCNTAWYLQQAGAKQFSGPFDWIFNSADILKHCLEDDFSTFLNKEMIYPVKDGAAAGHKMYHSSMFNHRNPLASGEDYDYHVRCVKRFLDAIVGVIPPVFICTLVNEPEKRVGWAKGFDASFQVPLGQTYNTYRECISFIASKNSLAKFVFIDQYTDQSLAISCDAPEENIFTIKLISNGRNTGVQYLQADDNQLALELYKSFVF